MALAFQIREELKIVWQSSLRGSYCWVFYSFLLFLRWSYILAAQYALVRPLDGYLSLVPHPEFWVYTTTYNYSI